MRSTANATFMFDDRNTRERAAQRRRAVIDALPCCPNCGYEIEPSDDIKRGAVVVQRNPDRILWNGQEIVLSPCETEMFICIFRRGRASYAAIDQVIADSGCNPATRSVLLWRIRQKFSAVGAGSPFATIGRDGIRFVAEADAQGSTATVIGLRRSSDQLPTALAS